MTCGKADCGDSRFHTLQKEADQLARHLANVIRERQGQGPLSKSDSADAAWQVVRDFIKKEGKGESKIHQGIERAQRMKDYWLQKAAQSPSKFSQSFAKAREADLEIRRLEALMAPREKLSDEDRADLVKLAHEVGDARRKRLKLVGP